MPNILRHLLLLLLILSAPLRAQIDAVAEDSGPLGSGPSSSPNIPAALQPWIPWVLEGGPEGQDQRDCPIDPADGARLCAWPGRLELALSGAGGIFAQVWEVFAESAVPLPGGADAWPLGVEVDGAAVAVVQRDGRPTATLATGIHRVTGRFVWDRPPDALLIPPMVGLVELVRDGRAVPTPRLDRTNRLWLGDPAGSETERSGDRLSLEVYRRIQDSLPLEVLTRLRLEVSGGAREVRLGPVLLPGGIPLRIDSPLPARIEEDGMLRVQVRPGRWVVDVMAHHQGDVSELSRPETGAPWPEREIWAFAAEPALRRVEPSGLDAVDPRQTGIPEEWSRLPVYRAEPGAVLRLAEQARGDPDPGRDRLRLDRELWLDFDGKGYSVQDRIGGQLSRGWRLDAGPALALGAVTLDGRPVLITRLNDTASPGVEVRRGILDVVADARLESAPGRVPASGWATEFENVAARLYLPPGWDLLTVQGVDNLPSTWVGRWSLLDLFLVLITTLGIGRIWGWGWALLALLTLGLTWQAPGAPRLIWLHLLAAAALLRLIPDAPVRTGLRRLRSLVTLYFRLALLGLVVIGLPFLVTEVRDGLFPHLERSWAALGDAGSSTRTTAAPPPAFELGRAMDTEAMSKREGLSGALSEPAASIPEPIDLMDPDARLQTGAGIPDWRWNSVDLRWSGPVGERESARLWLLSPTLNLVLSLLGSVLLVLLGLRLAGLVGGRVTHGAGLALLVAVGLGTAVGPGPVSAEDLPSPELLQELRTRLLAPPDCLPHCVDLPLVILAATPDRLVLDLTMDAAVAVAAPVPGGVGGWLPTEIRVDGEPSDGLRQDAAGRLLLMLPAGRHAVRLAGPLASRDQVEIPLPMQPRLIRATVDGWSLEGLDSGGRAGAQVRLVRLSDTGAPHETSLAQGALPPLLRVERTLRMGIDWRVDTRVRRLSPDEFPVLIPVPLLPGESVQTPRVQVEGSAVLADLPAGRSEVTWSSRLEPTRELRLVAAIDPRLSEDWRLDVGPLWHLEYEGIAPIHRLGPAERWLPNWRPLPGETLVLTLTRPLGVPGRTLTIDRVDTRVEPGQRGTLSTLTLEIRSSQGGSHVVRLPDAAEPIAFSLDGRSLPLPDTAPEVELPLTPGSTRAELTWREPQPLGLGYRPNLPDLGSTAVNLNLSLSLPDDRWVLWTWGPRIGPAVLFWGILLVLIGLAAGLGRSRLTPLRMHDWLLLGIGLILAEVWVVLLVIGWLFALGLRHRLDPLARPAWRFNLIQTGLVILTLFALAGLLGAVQQGLLGTPEMQIRGNGSTATALNWYQDRGGPALPDVWVLSVPMWVYRALMLGWALWLAMRLLDWLRWGWEGLSKPLIWRETGAFERKRPAAKSTHDAEEMRLDL
ncbi:hypothetical protein [Thiocapsa bogorovii]|uniref:hypothetical protein n=1 Tax=Thiocapsa bogorovii TaxID=521689 RepID=UPI001E5C7D34|nr:hypothetical protein [Thiocapsa bogorovii]UHD16065.1 hypothetical protein LT988_22905 [Thiocapsa bogorovii]